MKSTLVIVGCIAILSTVIFFTRSSSSSNQERVNQARAQHFHKNFKNLRLDNRPNHLFWFVQISDIHISIFHDDDRIYDFKKFATETLNTIKPPVVLASGDLTDAKDRDYLGSRQYESEWKIYNEILTTANVRNRTLWLDLRGNHDNFNVPSSMSNNSYFKQYSVQGSQNSRSYMKIVHGSSGEKYSFIAVDACLEPGPKRPFNFIGMLTENDMTHLERLKKRSRDAGANYTIWFGHYPTSCVVTLKEGTSGLRRVISNHDNSLAYMCGHLHTLAGLIPNMYTLQNDTFLELEVADWKACRKYRIAAIDNGLLSFVDILHGRWPAILITNPKHSLFQIPHRQEAKLQLESTHIRLLAFSPAGINNCIVTIDSDFKEKCEKINENLFVVKWDPMKYSNGLHYITATVVDDYGRENQVTQPFRLDESQNLSFDRMAQFILRTDASTIFKTFFYVSLVMCMTPLILIRVWHQLVMGGIVNRKKSSCRSSMSWFQKYWILASINRLFWPILLYCIYLAIGPWAVCEVVDGQYGVLFIWGIYINGTFFPGSLTYLYAFSQLAFCQLPLIWIFSKCTAKRYYQMIGMPTKKHRGPMYSLRKIHKLAFYIIITIEIILSIYFGVYYGTIAFLLGPFRTWTVLLNIYLYYLAKNVPDHVLRPAVYVWSGADKPIAEEQDTTAIEPNGSHSN